MTSEYLLDRELGQVLAALPPANALVCRVCVSTGLRVGDALALRTDQLKPQFWITEQKTKKRRRINLKAELLKELKEQAGQIWVFPGARDFTKHRTRQVSSFFFPSHQVYCCHLPSRPAVFSSCTA